MSTHRTILAVILSLTLGAIAGCDDQEVEEVAAPAPEAARHVAEEVDVERAADDVAEVAAPAPTAAAKVVEQDEEAASEQGDEQP